MTTFLDTSYLLALLRKRDSLHQVAVSLRPVFEGPLLTTGAVLIEMMDSMAALPLRGQAMEAFHLLCSEPRVRVVDLSPELLDDAARLFADRRDKACGLTDCISFRVMESEGVKQALTADRPFEQAGFVALMRTG